MEAAVLDMAAPEAIAAVVASDNASPFDPSRYKVDHDIAVLDEHQPGPDGEGNPRPYIGYSELKAVVDEANERIADTGDYVAINIGHTSDDPNAKPQPAVGFAGPFRLQKIGVKHPRWAIVADQWAIKKQYEREADGFPRRSVELWFSKKTGRPVMMDPISLLGATTPERALGLKLSAKSSRGDLVCERYEMGNKAKEKEPSAANNAKPAEAKPAEGNQPAEAKTSSPESQKPAATTPAEPITPTEQEARFLALLEQTDYVQYTRDLMKRHAAEVAASLEEGSGELGKKDDPIPGQETDDNEENGDMPAIIDKEKSAKVGEQDTAPGGNGDDATNKGAKDKTEKENYAKAAQERDEYRDKYQKEKREKEDLAARVEAMESKFATLETEKREVVRYNKLRDLVDRGYILDLDEEAKEVKDMSDAECERYMKGIERNGRRAPIGHQVHDNLEVEKFAKSGDKDRDTKRQQVLDLCESEKISYEAACKKLGYKPTA